MTLPNLAIIDIEIDELDLNSGTSSAPASANQMPALPAPRQLAIVPPGVSATPAFAYDSLLPAIARDAKAAADRIRANGASATKSLFDIGRDLSSIKLSLPHGEFGKWIEAEFRMTARSAQNYMNAATLASAKSEIISVLPPATIYKLAAPNTPTEIQEAVIAEIEQGTVPTTLDILQRIAEAQEKKAAKQAEERLTASRTPEQIARRRKLKDKQLKDQLAAAEKSKLDHEERKRIGGEAVAMLTRCLGAEYPKFRDLYKQAPFEVGRALQNA